MLGPLRALLHMPLDIVAAASLVAIVALHVVVRYIPLSGNWRMVSPHVSIKVFHLCFALSADIANTLFAMVVLVFARGRYVTVSFYRQVCISG